MPIIKKISTITFLLLLILPSTSFPDQNYYEYKFNKSLSIKIPSDWKHASQSSIGKMFNTAQKKLKVDIAKENSKSNIQMITPEDESVFILMILEKHESFKNSKLSVLSEKEISEYNDHFKYSSISQGKDLYEIIGWANLEVIQLNSYYLMTFSYLKKSPKHKNNREVTTYFFPFGDKSFSLFYERDENNDKYFEIVKDMLYSLKNEI